MCPRNPIFPDQLGGAILTFPPKTGPLPARVWGGRTAQKEGPECPGDGLRRSRLLGS